MSEITKELILCCKKEKKVIWKLLLLNNCHLLICWIYFTNPNPTFILETKLRTKTACVKPACSKHSCRCLHSVHFWKESTEVGEIKWPLNYCVQWKFLAKHIFSFHFLVQHICAWGESHSWLQNIVMSCLRSAVGISQLSTGRNLELFSVDLTEMGRNRLFCDSKKYAFSKEKYNLFIRESWRLLHFLSIQTSPCTSRPNRIETSSLVGSKTWIFMHHSSFYLAPFPNSFLDKKLVRLIKISPWKKK